MFVLGEARIKKSVQQSRKTTAMRRSSLEEWVSGAHNRALLGQVQRFHGSPGLKHPETLRYLQGWIAFITNEVHGTFKWH